MFGKIRRLHFRERLSINEIARRTRLSRNMIKRWLTAEGGTEPKYRRPPADTKLTPYEAQRRQWLEADSHRPKRERRTALALFGELRKQGFTGSYPRVSEFVRQWHEAKPGRGLAAAFVPLRFTLGEAFQFDWSEEPFVIGGLHRRLQVAHLKLCASRVFLLVAYPTQGQEMLFDAHTRAFTVFGGVPRRPGGDRIMVQVLACVPTFGLEAVQVAAELVLDSGLPSLEHVRNVLSRLNEPAPIAAIETALRLREEPRADAGRYDRLQALQTLEVGDE